MAVPVRGTVMAEIECPAHLVNLLPACGQPSCRGCQPGNPRAGKQLAGIRFPCKAHARAGTLQRAGFLATRRRRVCSAECSAVGLASSIIPGEGGTSCLRLQP